MIIEKFDILMVELFLLVSFSYVFSICVYIRRVSYRPAIIKGLLVWLILWALLSISAISEFRSGNPEASEGALILGLPTSLPLELEFMRGALSYEAQFYISNVLILLNWAGIFALAAVVFKKAASRFRRPLDNTGDT